MQNSDFWTRITSLYGSQTWPVFLCMYNSVISTRITRLYGFQPSSVVLWIKNSDLMTTIACVYGSQTSPAIFACKTAWLASELLVFMDPSPHVWILDGKQRLLDRITNLYWSQTSPVVLCMQYSVISTRITCLYGSQPLSVVFTCKTANFGAELQVCMCHSSHLWFLHAQQRTLDQNFKSVRVPDLICGFVE